MAERAIRRGAPPAARDPHLAALHAGAITIVVLSAASALTALVAGSPLQFGVALALCGAGCIAADFVRWTDERECHARRCAVPAARLNPDYGSSHVVSVGVGEHFSCTAPAAGTRLAA